MNDAPAWFHNAIVDGLMRLQVLSLPGTPAAETVTLTTTVWIDALWSTGVRWEEQLDVPRLQEAFRTLARTSERWPAPRTVMACLPARPEQPKLEAPVSGADTYKKRKALAAIRKYTKEWKVKHGTTTVQR